MTDLRNLLPSKSSKVIFPNGPGSGLCRFKNGLNGGRLFIKPPLGSNFGPILLGGGRDILGGGMCIGGPPNMFGGG